jgi:hypothetical protein
LIADLPFERLVVGPYRPFQIKIGQIEARTKLDFGRLRSADPLEKGAFESLQSQRIPLTSLNDIVMT